MNKTYIPLLIAAGLVIGYFVRGDANPPPKRLILKPAVKTETGENLLGVRIADPDPGIDLQIIRKKIDRLERGIPINEVTGDDPPRPDVPGGAPDEGHPKTDAGSKGRMQELRKALDELHAHARQLLKQGKEDKLEAVKQRIEHIHGELHKLEKDHEGHKHKHGEDDGHHHHPNVPEQIEHLLEAAKHLHKAGRGEMAERVEHEAHELKHEWERRRGLHEVMEVVQELRKEVQRLRKDVNALRRQHNRNQPPAGGGAEDPAEDPAGESTPGNPGIAPPDTPVESPALPGDPVPDPVLDDPEPIRDPGAS